MIQLKESCGYSDMWENKSRKVNEETGKSWSKCIHSKESGHQLESLGGTLLDDSLQCLEMTKKLGKRKTVMGWTPTFR